MNFYVIGNGFDLHYNLKTRYSDFKNWLKINNIEIFNKTDDIFKRYNNIDNATSDSLWSNFENSLTFFNELDSEELFDNALLDSEINIDKASYWTDPLYNIESQNNYIRELKTCFLLWIKQIDTKVIDDHIFNFKSNDKFLNFNYTFTIEENFGIKKDNVLHIHGDINNRIIIGHNCKNINNLRKISKHDNSLSISINEKINDYLKNIYSLYYKKSKQIIKNNIQIFKNLKYFNDVIFVGFSCGDQDKLYVTKIMKYSKHITFYYYKNDNKSCENFEKIARLCKFNKFSFVEW